MKTGKQNQPHSATGASSDITAFAKELQNGYQVFKVSELLKNKEFSSIRRLIKFNILMDSYSIFCQYKGIAKLLDDEIDISFIKEKSMEFINSTGLDFKMPEFMKNKDSMANEALETKKQYDTKIKYFDKFIPSDIINSFCETISKNENEEYEQFSSGEVLWLKQLSEILTLETLSCKVKNKSPYTTIDNILKEYIEMELKDFCKKYFFPIEKLIRKLEREKTV